jgi:hypothetical protein
VTDISTRPSGLQHTFSRIRTNDGLQVKYSGDGRADWELREFRLNSRGVLEQHSVPGTPDKLQNGQLWLFNVINSAPRTVRGVPVLPEFREGASSMNDGVIWSSVDAAGQYPDHERRHQFSLHTCSGCHGGETQTNFRHVREAAFRIPTQMSGFLTGQEVDAPVRFEVLDPFTDQMRAFSDLERRRQDLQDLIDSPPIRHFIGP